MGVRDLLLDVRELEQQVRALWNITYDIFYKSDLVQEVNNFWDEEG